MCILCNSKYIPKLDLVGFLWVSAHQTEFKLLKLSTFDLSTFQVPQGSFRMDFCLLHGFGSGFF